MNTTEATITATTAAITVGSLAKQWEAFPDRFIPSLVSVVGAVAYCASAGWTVANAFVGFISGAAATGINQNYRQLKKDA